MDGRTEWASEGEPKQVGEPELALRKQSQRMIVRKKWAHSVKPGGTAGTIYPLLSQHFAGTGAFCFSVPPTRKGGKYYVN